MVPNILRTDPTQLTAYTAKQTNVNTCFTLSVQNLDAYCIEVVVIISTAVTVLSTGSPQNCTGCQYSIGIFSTPCCKNPALCGSTGRPQKEACTQCPPDAAPEFLRFAECSEHHFAVGDHNFNLAQ